MLCTGVESSQLSSWKENIYNGGGTNHSYIGIADRFSNEAELMWPETEQINFIRSGKQTAVKVWLKFVTVVPLWLYFLSFPLSWDFLPHRGEFSNDGPMPINKGLELRMDI